MTGPDVGSGALVDPAIGTLEAATARDGTAVHLRLLRRDERELVAGFFAGLTAESRYRRFLQPMPRLPETMLRRLVDVDGRRHVAMVAEVDGQCVGIARYLALADEPGAAEVAVTVTDRYQGRGIGRLLVEALRPLAANLPVELVNHAGGHHAFDTVDDTDESRRVIRRVLAFLGEHLTG